jgi:hypothetical protein
MTNKHEISKDIDLLNDATNKHEISKKVDSLNDVINKHENCIIEIVSRLLNIITQVHLRKILNITHLNYHLSNMNEKNVIFSRHD